MQQAYLRFAQDNSGHRKQNLHWRRDARAATVKPQTSSVVHNDRDAKRAMIGLFTLLAVISLPSGLAFVIAFLPSLLMLKSKIFTHHGNGVSILSFWILNVTAFHLSLPWLWIMLLSFLMLTERE